MRDAILHELISAFFVGLAVVAVAALLVFRALAWLGSLRRKT